MKHLYKTVAAVVMSGGLIGTTAILHADDDAKISNALYEAPIQMDKAVSIALAAVPGMAYEAEFEFEDGKPIWEVDVVDANKQVYELEVDAHSGAVLSQELEDD